MVIEIFVVLLLITVQNNLSGWQDITGEDLFTEHTNIDGQDSISNKMFDIDSLNCRFVGNWQTECALALAYDSLRHLCFLGSGCNIYILDVTNPSSQLRVLTKICTGDFIYHLLYQNGHLYVAARDAGIEIWDVKDPLSPQKLATYNTPGCAYSVFVSGAYAFVADDYAGIRIVDISNPSSPYEVGYYDTPGYAYDVYVCDSYMYAIDWNGRLWIINIAKPSTPYEVSNYTTSDYAEAVCVSGVYAFVANCCAGIKIIDISNPSLPYEVGYYDTPGSAYDIHISGSYAFVADEFGGVRIIDIADPSTPYEVSYYDTPGLCYDVYVDSVIYVADGDKGLQIYYGPTLEPSELTMNYEYDKAIKIIPKPANLYFAIRTTNTAQNSTLFLYDITGRLIKKEKVKDSISISLSDVQSGVYFIKINNRMLKDKLVVVK